MMSAPEPFAPFIVRRLWSPQSASFAGWRRVLVQVLRVVYAVVRDIVEGRLALHAASLVYTSILSLVPILALGFSVLKGFGVHYRFEPLLLSALAPLGSQAKVVAERLLGFVDKMDVGVLGVVGMTVLFYTAISVVQKIETACNDIWHVRQTRPLARRFTDYLSVLLIGPVLIFSALGIAGSVIGSEWVQRISAIRPLGLLIETAVRLVPFLLLLGAFTFTYKFLPNARVPLRSALMGSAVASVIWVIAGLIFADFAQGASSYEAVYSALAALILFFIWLDVSWLVVLIGAAISFYDAHPESLLLGGDDPALSNRTRERFALAVMRTIGAAQYAGEPPLTTDAIARRLKVSGIAIGQVLQALREGGILSPSADSPARWLPARPLDATPVMQVLDAVRGGADGVMLPDGPASATVFEMEGRAERAIAAALKGLTLRDLALGDELAQQPAQDRQTSGEHPSRAASERRAIPAVEHR